MLNWIQNLFGRWARKKKQCTVGSSPAHDVITRTETFAIKLQAAEITSKNIEFINTQRNALGLTPIAAEGDTCDFSYCFNANYINNCNEHLRAVINLIDHEDVKIISASLAEIRHGRSIIVELVAKLSTLIKHINEKTEEIENGNVCRIKDC